METQSEKSTLPASLKVPAQRPGAQGGPRDTNRRKRAQTLCEAALPRFLSHGVGGVSIDEIVGRAKMAKGSFYRYFNNKEDLVAALFAPLNQAILSAFDGCKKALEQAESAPELNAAYQVMGQGLTEAIFQNPQVALLYLQECRAPAVDARKPIRDLADRIQGYALAITHVAIDHELLRIENPKVSALATIGAVETLLYRFLSGENLGDPMEVSRQLTSLVLDGLRNPT